MLRRVLPLFAALFLTARTAPPASTVASAGTPPAVITSYAGRNAAVQHYTFDVDARIALLTFPWIRFTLHGHGTYTRGGEYSVHFDDVPWFGKGYETMPMSALDVSNWTSMYTMSVAGSQGNATILSMHDVKKSNLVEARAQIDPAQGLQQILWTYDYGGHVKLTIVPQAVSGLYFPGSEEAEIVMPHYRAMAWATFSNYQVAKRSPAVSTATGKR
jgi:hypothetical protein